MLGGASDWESTMIMTQTIGAQDAEEPGRVVVVPEGLGVWLRLSLFTFGTVTKEELSMACERCFSCISAI